MPRAPSALPQILQRAKELWDRSIKYFEGKLYNRALKDLQEAIELNPEYGKEAVELMQVFSMQGNDEQAVSVGYALLKTDSTNVELMNKLGNSLRNLNSFDKAKRLYTHALKVNPKFIEALRRGDRAQGRPHSLRAR